MGEYSPDKQPDRDSTECEVFLICLQAHCVSNIVVYLIGQATAVVRGPTADFSFVSLGDITHDAIVCATLCYTL